MGNGIVKKRIKLVLGQRLTIKTEDLGYRRYSKVYICGNVIHHENRLVYGATVIAYYVEGQKKIPICYTFSRKNGFFELNIDYEAYKGKRIEITSIMQKNKPSYNHRYIRLRHDIKIDQVKDIILYGKVTDCNGKPVKGAVVAAFYEEKNNINEICHTFSGIDGVYMLNIDYDLFKQKKIVIRGVKTSYPSTVCC